MVYRTDNHCFGVRSSGDRVIVRQGLNYHIDASTFFKKCDIIITDEFSYEATLRHHDVNGVSLFGDNALFIDISDLIDESEAFKELFRNQRQDRRL